MILSINMSAVVKVPEDIEAMVKDEKQRDICRNWIEDRCKGYLYRQFKDEQGIFKAEAKFLPDET